jgi:hypothetical protein
MKRIILILWAVLASGGWLLANHWTPNSTPYEDNMTLTGIVRIDGIEQQTTALEVGAFCGEECRGSAQLTFFYPSYRYVVQIVVYGNVGDQFTFRLYDQELDEELDLITYDTVTFVSEGYGSLMNPYVFNFYTAPPGPHTVTVWADPEVGGTVTGGGTYNHGATVTLTATANEDYRFVYWVKDGWVVSDSTTFDFIVTEPSECFAYFELDITPHWTPTTTSYEDNMTITGVIQINGVEQQNPMLEVAAFCGEECRGTAIPTFFYPSYHYVVQMVVFGNIGDPLTFKLYDHELNEELDLHSTNAVSFSANGYGSLGDPYVINFTEALIETHTVTATVNLAEGGTVTGPGVYLHGTTCNMVAIPNEGYEFVNWTEDGMLVSVSSSYDFEVTCDRSLVANFVPDEGNHWIPNTSPYEDNMTLTGIVQINSVEQQTSVLEVGVFCGEECRGSGRPSFFEPAQRYVIQLVVYGNSGDQLTFRLFDHEQGIEPDLTPPDSIIFTESGYGSLMDPYALNFRESFAITTSANPIESGTMTGAGTYVYGTTATLTATANTGYHFLNWTLNGTMVSNQATYSFTVTEAAEYVANFGLNSYNIFAMTNPTSGGTVSGAGSYYHFSTCTLTATPNTGYHFVNWTMNGTVVSTEQSYSFEVTGPAYYVANFELNSYEINATANPEAGGTVTGAGIYNHFSTCTLTATPNTGYHFVNWTKNGQQVSTNASYSFTVTDAAEYVANFGLNSYSIFTMVNPTAGGVVTGAGTYYHFDTCTLTATANEGYHFLNWTSNGTVVSTETTYSFEVMGSASYVANFELYSYDITATANPTEGGTVTGAGTYDHFSTCTLVATANTGYHFVSWTQDGSVVSTGATYSFEVTGAASYVANFEINSYDITVTANPTEGGTVTGAGTYDHFSTCTLTATAGTGYHFLNWTLYGTIVSTEASYSFEVTSPAEYVANFELNSYTITAEANPEVGGTITGAGTYNHFSTCTLTATANEYYAFVNWTRDGVEVSTNETYSFTVTEDAAFVANFVLTTITQTIPFATGWNWWSSYIESEDADLLGQLESGLGTNGITIKSQAGYVQYMPGYDIWYGSTNFSVNNETFYMIQTTADCEVGVEGLQANPAEHPITLATGWNWIGYPCTSHMSFATAFSDITPSDNDQVKSQSHGFASYMAAYDIWYGTLADYGIDPGMGLMYKSNNSSSFTFTYPDSRGDDEPSYIATENHWTADYNAYPNNMTVTAVVELNDVELHGDNYELAAFANGECRGSVRLMHVAPLNRYMAFLTIAGEEAADLNFGLYDTETGMVETQCITSLQYETNAVVGSLETPYVIRFRNTTGVDDWANSLHVFPNPVARGAQFTLGLTADEIGKVQIEIINALGVVETMRTMSVQTIAAPDVAGVYTLRITVEGKGTCYRKLVVR